ncbi:hypothetical protein CALCODRAFT_508803 [Calocera cornea HHB12733]|uniref:Uncharacterized protein n=1 Tax=Calocera cornea HHB12733 TaxID=1353952 RepID=A0A165G1U7_9BASI|nr:hypothetical protein CALCODRAFT_508803 [Calocera cornea HHB12733]
MTLWLAAIATGLLAFRIWKIDSASARMKEGSLRPLARIIVESGVIYTGFMIAVLVVLVMDCPPLNFFNQLRSPVTAITFYLIIYRAGSHRTVQRAASAARAHATFSLNSQTTGVSVQYEVTIDCEEHGQETAHVRRSKGTRKITSASASDQSRASDSCNVSVGRSQLRLGQVALYKRREVPAALRSLRQARHICRHHPLFEPLHSLGEVLLGHNDLDSAELFFGESLTIQMDVDYEMVAGYALLNPGATYRQIGDDNKGEANCGLLDDLGHLPLWELAAMGGLMVLASMDIKHNEFNLKDA